MQQPEGEYALSGLVPENPDAPVLVRDELLELIEEREGTVLDFVEDRLEDNDGQVLEERAGEEVHLAVREGRQARAVSSRPTPEAASERPVPDARRRWCPGRRSGPP